MRITHWQGPYRVIFAVAMHSRAGHGSCWQQTVNVETIL